MSYLDDTFKQYVDLRNNGREAKAALETLRLRIELLDAIDRQEIVRRVREWEADRKQGTLAYEPPPPPAPTIIKPPANSAPPKRPESISSRLAQASVTPPAPPAPAARPNVDPFGQAPPQQAPAFAEQTTPIDQPQGGPQRPAPVASDMIRCPNCRKPNKSSDVFCFSCGEFLRKDKTPNHYETQRFNDTGALPSADYFGEESTLILTVASLKESHKFTVRPQEYRHEVVVGRSDGGTMTPDVDLAAHNAGDLGVSRLHVALQYNSRNNILSISDMKSANGTYVNGQKLYPQEVRVLRHGDELRLGRMVMRVFFEHGDSRPR